MLSKREFDALVAIAWSGAVSQREIARSLGVSVGTANNTVRALREAGMLDEAGGITKAGQCELEQRRVRSAVVLAAGTGSRFAPLSFEKPRAMFEVRGEVLIERLIRQLKEAGIEDITVVVGYMKELFFYLEDMFGVRIVVNGEYANRNNSYSLWCARDKVSGTYVCPADQYYAQNIFAPYAYASYCNVVYREGAFDGQVVEFDGKGRVTDMRAGGGDAYRLQGAVYLDPASSKCYLEILGAEIDRPETATKLWDDLLVEHIDEFDLYAQVSDPAAVREFDYVGDLVAFDRDFFANVDSRILDNICSTLDCAREDIASVEPVNAGLTNLSVLFEVRGCKYVYRHPGNGTEDIINRQAEAHALSVAKRLGLDESFVYEDPREGWKISSFIEGCSELDYEDLDQVKRALELVRKLHESGETSPWSFDFFAEAKKIVTLLEKRSYPLPRDFDELQGAIVQVAEIMAADAGDPVLCHNDFYGPNVLVRGDEMWLIDWEYSAMGDYACDIGNFVAQGPGHTVQEAVDLLDFYYGRPPTPEEKRHCLAAIAVVGYYWYVWAMYKEAMGNPVGEWIYVWYKAAKRFSAAALQ